MSNDTTVRQQMNSIFADKVRRARATPSEQKLADGPQLFDMNSQVIKAAIRSQFPELSDEQVEQEYGLRLQIARVIDSAGIYRDAGLIDE